MDWYFCQMKGTTEEEINEADIISCLEFDETGEFIATGDKGGRVVVFRRNHNVPDRSVVDYGVHCTFTSHEPEFDYLKSLEIEEKINKIKWLPQSNESRFLLSTNDKTIKLWRISERHKRPVGFNFRPDQQHNMISSPISSNNHQLSPIYSPPNNYNELDESRFSLVDDVDIDGLPNPITSPNHIRIPHYQLANEPIVIATPRRIFANAHAYHINSISVNSDQQTFLSADDLRINIWNLQMTNQSFNIVDIKPTNMEDLTEVITAAQFHPSCCSLFIYSSSKGIIRLCDMRERALCDNNAIVFEEPDDSTNRSFFSEIISSISDINFSHSGRYILSRDYLTLKIWDMNMTKSPLVSYPVHDYLRMKLCALYENDCIFDKFECCWSPDDRYVMTGSYNNFFRIFPREPTSNLTGTSVNPATVGNQVAPSINNSSSNTNSCRGDITLEVGRDLLTSDKPLSPKTISQEGGHQRKPNELSVDCVDFQRRLLHLAWHPRGANVLALAATNNLYVLEGRNRHSNFHDNLANDPTMSVAITAGSSSATTSHSISSMATTVTTTTNPSSSSSSGYSSLLHMPQMTASPSSGSGVTSSVGTVLLSSNTNTTSPNSAMIHSSIDDRMDYE